MPPTDSTRPNGQPIRVLIVDDSAFMRSALSRLLSGDPEIKVVDTGRNGQEAIDKVKTLRPDVLTLDIEMPILDGLGALKKMKSDLVAPNFVGTLPAILVCSSLTTEGSHHALTAMRLGAADVIAKEGSQFSLHMDAMRDDLVAKIKAIAHARALRMASSPSGAERSTTLRALRPKQMDLVVIGSSTGGPPVLESILTVLPKDFPCPIVVAQHMPPIFTKSLSERFATLCAIGVQHGEQGSVILPGTITIAPGGKHSRIVKGPSGKLTLLVSDEPKSALYKPSVNELFVSAAAISGARTLGIVCTGMGDDGALGAERVKAVGGMVLTQSARTCVVYGMPRSVDVAGFSDGQMAPADLGMFIATLSMSGVRIAA